MADPRQVWFWRFRAERELVYKLQAVEAAALADFQALQHQRWAGPLGPYTTCPPPADRTLLAAKS